MSHKYRVLPFIGKIKGNQSADAVSAQLESLINDGAKNGFEFVQLGSVNIEIKPGFFAGLFGAKTDYTRFDMAVFKQDD